ncbi:MAG: hypothetical protein V5A33_06625, partial [Halobacteriales archaeon]
PQYDDQSLMKKCNLCRDKGPGRGVDAPPKHEQEDPLTPACADECVGDALHAGPVEDLLDMASEDAQRRFLQDDDCQVIVESAGDRERNGNRGLR